MRQVAMAVLALVALVALLAGSAGASPEDPCGGLAPAAVGTGPGQLPLGAGAEARPASACEAARNAADAGQAGAEDAEPQCTATGASLGLEDGTYRVGGLRVHTGIRGGSACPLLGGWRGVAQGAEAFVQDMCGTVARFVGPPAAGLC